MTIDTPDRNEINKLLERLNSIPCPPKTEEHAIETVRVSEKLADIGFHDSNISIRLQNLLFFFPPKHYREIFWPAIWVRSCRLLRRKGLLETLKEVALSDKPHYLSALGAIALASSGFIEGDVPTWLTNARDYHLLTEYEREELQVSLAAVGLSSD